MRPVLALMLGVLLALAACGHSPAPAPSGTRIVVLSPAAAVILRDLGHQDRIVGRHASDMVLPPALPICGDQAAVDLEALQAVHPTHVITQWGARELPKGLTDLATRHGWHLREVTLMTLDDISREIIALDSDVAGTSNPQAATVGSRFTDALRPRPGVAAAGRVLLLAGVDPPGALGPGSCHHELLERIGAKPAITSGGPWQELAHEDVLRAAPDVIVLVLPRGARTPPEGGTEAAKIGPAAAAKLGRLGSLDLAAVKRGRVVWIDDPLGLTPSTAMGGVAEQLAAALERLGPP